MQDAEACRLRRRCERAVACHLAVLGVRSDRSRLGRGETGRLVSAVRRDRPGGPRRAMNLFLHVRPNSPPGDRVVICVLELALTR